MATRGAEQMVQQNFPAQVQGALQLLMANPPPRTITDPQKLAQIVEQKLRGVGMAVTPELVGAVVQEILKRRQQR